jgi:hypothetical protein
MRVTKKPSEVTKKSGPLILIGLMYLYSTVPTNKPDQSERRVGRQHPGQAIQMCLSVRVMDDCGMRTNEHFRPFGMAEADRGPSDRRGRESGDDM